MPRKNTKYRKYSLEQKNTVLKLAKKLGTYGSSKKTSIPRSTIRFWVTSSGNSSKVTRGRKPKLSKKQEAEILQSMLCKRIKGDPVHEKDLHDKVIFF